MSLDAARYFGKSEKTSYKKVYYTGTDTLQVGYALCYNRDSTTGDSAGGPDLYRAWEVEKPATANLAWFAGVVAPTSNGFAGPGFVDIIEPFNQPLCEVYTNANCTLGTTKLGPTNAQYYLAAVSASVPHAATAYATVNRSGTAGTALAQLHPISLANIDAAAAVTAVTKATGSTVGATQEEVLLSTTMTDATGATVGSTQEETLLSPNTLAAAAGTTTGGTHLLVGATVGDTAMQTAANSNFARLASAVRTLRNDDAKLVKVVNLIRDDTAKLATQLNAVITALKNANLMAS